jgi:hypothetical protein
MLYDTVAEYDTAIAEARISLRRSLLVGLHSKNVTDGGTERTNSEVDMDKVRAYISLLIRERKMLTSTIDGRVIGAGW